jgi:hypothetical protein
MSREQAPDGSVQSTRDVAEQLTNVAQTRRGLDDPRALEILTTEHWSLLSTRTLGYTEMFARATIFVALLSATLVAFALLAQVNHFGPETLPLAFALISVALFIGATTFARSVAVNDEDARWLAGMNLLRQAYLQIVPELEPFFITGHARDVGPDALGHGRRQRGANLVHSLTTTSGLISALNSVLAGLMAATIAALFGAITGVTIVIAIAVSLVSAAIHIRYAAWYRQVHQPAHHRPPSVGDR